MDAVNTTTGTLAPGLLPMWKPMDDPNNTTGTLEANEDILTCTVSDEAIEAAAGIERGEGASILPPQSQPCLLHCLVWRD
jgi:hypothetical protein